MTLAFESALEFPYFEGEVSVGVGVGFVYPVSLAGFGYEIDDKVNKITHQSVPLLRAAIDERETPGSATLNPEAFWRRSFRGWHVGAGQTHFDREGSNEFRFRRSKGIDVWDRHQVSLLPAVAQKLSGATNMRLAVAGTFLYLTDGTALKRTADITVGSPTFTTITGGTAATFSSIASDGFNILLAAGASGIDKTTRGAATKVNHITGTVTEVAYGKGRWVATAANNLYDITTLVAGGGALPAALYTHPNTDFAWNSFAEGPSAFYVGGFSGDKSLIYRLTMKEDGTGLNQPVVAGFLPDGEIIRSMQGYLGFVLIGTSEGARIGVPGGNGDLTVGALIPTDTDVLAFEGQDRYVWFGWGNHESTDAGLGRLNLETFSDVDALAPAYASDLMAGVASGNTQSIVTFQSLRCFVVNNATNGLLYAEGTNLVASGQIDSGLFDYGLTDEKLSLYVDMTHLSHDGGSHSIYLSVDRAAFSLLATMEDEHLPVPTGEARGHEFEIRLVLNNNPSDQTMGPVIRSWALRSQPATTVTEIIDLPLFIAPKVTRRDGLVEEIDSIARAQSIKALCHTKEVTLLTIGDEGFSVIVTDYQRDIFDTWVAGDSPLGNNATCLTRCKVVT